MLHPAFPTLPRLLIDWLFGLAFMSQSLTLYPVLSWNFPGSPRRPQMCSDPSASVFQILDLQTHTSTPVFSGLFRPQKVHYQVDFLSWKHVSWNDKRWLVSFERDQRGPPQMSTGKPVGIFHTAQPSHQCWSLWSCNQLCTRGLGGINQWIQINLWDEKMQSKWPKVTRLIMAHVLQQREHTPSSTPCCPLCSEEMPGIRFHSSSFGLKHVYHLA